MSNPESTPPRDLSRAHWQRTEGAVVYSRVFEHVLASVGKELTDPMLIDHLSGCSLETWSVVDRIVQLPYQLFSAANLPNFSTQGRFEDSVGQRITKFAFRRNLLETIDEGLETMMGFPATLLFFIDSEHAKFYGRPLIENLSDICEAYESPDFSTIVHDAAFAPNGFWDGKFSQLPNGLTKYNIQRKVDSLPDLTADSTSRLGFKLNTANQLSKIRENNKRGLSTVVYGKNIDDLTSSGCPVRLTRPQFTEMPQDVERLQQLSRCLRETPEEIVTERPLSGIQTGLNFMADVFKRANAIILAKKLPQQLEMPLGTNRDQASF